MRKKSLLFTFLLSLIFAAHTSASWADLDTIPNDSLVISEIQIGDHSNFIWWGYFELTNMSSKPMDMSSFFVQGAIQSQLWKIQPVEGNAFKANLHGTLNPGESYLFVGRSSDSRTDPLDELINPLGYANQYMVDIADQIGYHIYSALDSMGSRVINGGWKFALFSRFKNPAGFVDSARVDQFWFNGDFDDENEDQNPFRSAHLIAGISSDYPQRNFIWIRKHLVKKGNLDFNSGRGNDISDSEWMPAPRIGYDQWSVMYTTARSHGASTELILSSDNEKISIDKDNMIISMPLNVRRDSVFREFKLGPNTAYDLKYGMDTTQHFMQVDDSLLFYVYGDSLAEYKFSVVLNGQVADLAEVSPLYYKVSNPPTTSFTGFVKRYEVSQGYDVDTIGNVSFGTRIDTLEKYLVVPEGASITYKFIDNVDRLDLKDGDEMIVTSSGGTKKTYRITVEPYYPSMNASLKTVIFPGLELFENPITFYPTDTFLSFSANTNIYIINLDEGTRVSPGIQAIPQNANANVYIQRAKNLNGTIEEQTAKIIVTAEDGETVNTYSFIFNVERDRPALVSEPFISDIANGIGFGSAGHMQIFNPNDEDLLFDQYMLFSIDKNSSWESFMNTWVANDSNFNQNNKSVLRPNYIIMPDETGAPVFQLDYNQNTAVLEPKATFWIATENGYPYVSGPSLYSDGVINPIALNNMENSILCTGKDWPYGNGAKDYYETYLGQTEYPYAEQNPQDATKLPYNDFRWLGHQGETVGIMKIINDSVLEGLKAMNADFENDYELVDIVNGKSTVGTAVTFFQDGYYNYVDDDNIAYVEEDTIFTLDETEFDAYNIYRKSSVFKGNPIDQASFGRGDIEENRVDVASEWEAYGFTVNPDGSDLWKRSWARSIGASRYRNHVMITNVNIPYITSKLYVISLGLSENETIVGVKNNTSVADFLGNIIIPDTGMSVIVSNGGTEKGLDELLSDGDKVTSISADGKSRVVYSVSIGDLDNSTVLTSTEYTVEGTVVSGIPFGITLKEFVDNINVVSTATMSIVTGSSKDEIVPYMVYSNDTLEDGSAKLVDVRANDKMYVEVLAQDGETVAYYSLGFLAADPILLSDVFAIDQSIHVIDQLYGMSVATFKKLFYANPGAIVTVTDRNGLERVSGGITYDDQVLVSLGDKTVRYYMEFRSEVQERPESVNEQNIAGFEVYPNPTSDKIVVSGLKSAKDLNVYNVSGQLLKTIRVTQPVMSFEMGSYNVGVYMIEVVNKDNSRNTQKIVKY